MRRRRLLNSGLSLALGGFLLTSGSVSARHPPTASWTRYDPGSLEHTNTTVTAATDPQYAELTGLPDPVATVIEDLEARYAPVSLDQFTEIRGSMAIDGITPTCGAVIGTGTIDEPAVTAALDADGARPTGTTTTPTNHEFARFSRTDGYAIGTNPAALAIAFGPTAEAARTQLDGILTGTEPEGASVLETYGQLPRYLDGPARAYATLNDHT